MVMVEFSMFPVGEGESLGDKVARSVQIIDKSGLPYEVHAMGTILEGEWDEVFGVIRKCFLRMKEDSRRVSVSIKVDYREGKKGRIRGKVESVMRRLGGT